MAFAPVEKPEIALSVLVEHGGHGGSAAAPIAKKAIEAYMLPAEKKKELLAEKKKEPAAEGKKEPVNVQD